MPAPTNLPPLAQPALHWTIPGKPTYAMQAQLRPLPLPLLDDTLAAYLRSCKPLLSEAEYAATEEAVRAFATGPGPQLQRALEERAAATAAAGSHWLEAWWEHFAYLSCRAPLLVKWNIFSTLLDRTSHPQPLRRAARFVSAAASFYCHLQHARIAPDALDTRGRIPLCMHQFSRLYASSRVPGEEVDELVSNPTAQHVAVFCRGHAYSLRVLHGVDEAPVSAEELERSLSAIRDDADARGPNAHPLAMLTLLPRDQWARHRAAVLELDTPPGGGGGGPQASRPRATDNAASLAAIEGSLFALTLESAAPEDPVALSHACHEGIDGRSLWFDKSLSVLLFANGKLGINMEHAHFDAPVPSRMMGFVVRSIKEAEAKDPPHTESAPRPAGAQAGAGASASDVALSWQRVDFTLPASVKAAIANDAPKVFKQMCAINQLAPARFEGGGRLAVLALKGASADSVMQMAIQLAQWRDQKSFVATYESATTRRFSHGRTETIRSCSEQSAAFARAMDDPQLDDVQKFAALAAALQEHGAWLMRCSNGKGIDRHMMGLRIAAGMSGINTTLFADPAYAKTSTFALSTSNTSTPGNGPVPYFECGGFGAPEIDCYGVGYQIQEHAIQFMVSSDARSKSRDAKRFSGVLLQALSDTFGLVNRAAAAMGPSSKL